MVKYIIDVSMGISFIICFFTGLMKGPNIFLGRMGPSSGVVIIHYYSGLLLVLFVLIHLILNWGWIKDTTKKVINNIIGK